MSGPETSDLDTSGRDMSGLEISGLEISDLHKSFGAHPVLAGLDLEVPAGSLTAILGPSGSGKTTLLRLLAGFEAPDRGRSRSARGSSTGRASTSAPSSAGSATSPRRAACFPT